MSVIQNIRTKYAKVAGFLIALALVGFILMDSANGPLSGLFGRDTSVAKVNGNKIDRKTYDERYSDYETLYEVYAKGRPLDDATRAQIRQQVLQELVYQELVKDQMEKLGVQITEQEQKDMTHGAMPDPMVQQFPYFADPNTGQFNAQYIAAFEKQVPQIQDPNQREKLLGQWASLQRFVGNGRLTQKFNALVVNSVYTPSFLAKAAALDMGSTASVRFVKIPFTTVEDSKVPVSEAELKDYLQKHKAQYSIDEPTRSIEYVTFDIVPSAADTARSLGMLNNLKAEFATAPDAAVFVNRNSDNPFDSTYVTKKTLQSPMADSILSQPVGAVVGPFYEGTSYSLVKVVNRKQQPDSVRAKHILIAVNTNGGRTDTAAHVLIDSLKMAIQSGANFDTLASRFSDDPGSKIKGGDLGYFAQGMMVPEFNDVAFKGKTGDLETVKTQFGWHLIRLVDQKDFQPASQLAIVSKQLASSTETNNSIFSKANEFAGKNTTGKAFDEAIKKQGLNKKVAENIRINDFTVNGLGSSRDLVKWMYDAKTNDISTPLVIENSRYVVAKLSNVQEAGIINLDANTRPQVEALIKAKKKADIIAGQYKNVASLEAVSGTSKQPIQQADSFNASNSFAPNIGFEPKVVGYSFYAGLKQGAVSPAIKGMDGVFFISPITRTIATQVADPNAMSQQKMMGDMQNKNALSGMLQQVFQKNASIKYNPKNL